MKKSIEITTCKDVRAFTRSSADRCTLSNQDLLWLKKGSKLSISTPMTMVYDHRDQIVVQVHGEKPDRFIILEELERDPWYLSPPTSSAINN
jgi:hypothetical protein